MQKVIRITPKRISSVLLGIISFLLIANLAIIYLRFSKGFQHLKGFSHGFYFDAEANFPSLYSALAILFSALLLWLIGGLRTEKESRRAFYWKFLSIVFVLLAMDEFGSLHEYMIEPMRGLMNESPLDSGYLYFAWFIPYTIVVLIIGMLLFRFFFGLPSPTRWSFIIAGTVFMAGAVGMEMLGGKYWAEQGWAIDGSDETDLQYALIVTVEELLEMLGIVIFIFALSKYYFQRNGKHTFSVTVSDP